MGKGLSKGSISAYSQVVFYRGWINLVVAVEKEALLSLIEWNIGFLRVPLSRVGVCVQQPLDDVPFEDCL